MKISKERLCCKGRFEAAELFSGEESRHLLSTYRGSYRGCF